MRVLYTVVWAMGWASLIFTLTCLFFLALSFANDVWCTWRGRRFAARVVRDVERQR
jgi:hypothetical protein